MNLQEWAIVERFGRAGETAADVMARVSQELVPVRPSSPSSNARSVDTGSLVDREKSSPHTGAHDFDGFMSEVDDKLKGVRVTRTRIDGLPLAERQKCEPLWFRKIGRR